MKLQINLYIKWFYFIKSLFSNFLKIFMTNFVEALNDKKNVM